MQIEVPDDAVIEAVTVLQPCSLIVSYEDADDWDLMGAAYEQYTHQNLKRQRGQFFTNRLVGNSMVQMIDPQIGEKVLDPAGGSGGFATAAFRHIRKAVLNSTSPNSPQRERQLDAAKQSIFLSEISPRLVKLAKTAMLLNGDGHTGMTQGNSLGPYYETMDPWIQSRCKRGVPRVILTNPPFAGQGEARITDPMILADFEVAKHQSVSKRTGEPIAELMNQQSPELLFFGRCLDWLDEGGRMGIVLPKAFLDTSLTIRAREWLFEKAFLNAVVTLHKDSFQPDTGVRTCIVFLTKKTAEQRARADEDYDIYMAMSQKIGQTSEGEPIFVMGDNGMPTNRIDHDLDEIALDYAEFNQGKLIPSQYRYAIKRSQIDSRLNINPQFYSPHLNESIETIRQFDDLEGWSVTTLGQLENGIRVFKGPRLKTENVIVSTPLKGELSWAITPHQRCFKISVIQQSS